MSVDDSKLEFSSNWEIDQLVENGTVTVPVGTTAIYTIPDTLPALPVFEVLFRRTGFSRFYSVGVHTTNGTLANLGSFSSYISDRKILITTDQAGTAKYLVWSDKLDY